MATARAFQEARTVLTALELDVFHAVEASGRLSDIAASLGASLRGTQLLLDALAGLGLLEKEHGSYRNSPFASEHLVADRPGGVRQALLHMAHLWDLWSGLTESVRTGQPAPRQGDRRAWTEVFIGAMHAHAARRAEALAAQADLPEESRILDLGGGSGAYSIALLRAVPGATAVILDLPEVVPITRRFLDEAGMADRVQVRAGDMLRDDLGQGFDAVLLSSVCHMFGPEENARLFQRCRRALAPGGVLLVSDFFLEEDGTSPPQAALFSLNMLVATERGRSYRESDYRRWLEAAGFTQVERRPLAGPADLLRAVAGGE